MSSSTSPMSSISIYMAMSVVSAASRSEPERLLSEGLDMVSLDRFISRFKLVAKGNLCRYYG